MPVTAPSKSPTQQSGRTPQAPEVRGEIRAVELYKRLGKRMVVNGVSFNVRQGEIVGLLGPNGAGKTTTFYLTVGLLRMDGGHVFVNEVDMTYKPIHLRARAGLGYLSQEPSIFRKMTVEQNLQTVLEMTGVRGDEQRERIDHLLTELDIQHVRKSLGYVLSGGERRRTEIARTLSTEPSFILLDEPFTGVEPIAVQELQKIVGNLRTRGIGILITDHNVRETFEIIDRGYILDGGKIVAHGTPSQLMRDPLVRKVYLGDRFA